MRRQVYVNGSLININTCYFYTRHLTDTTLNEILSVWTHLPRHTTASRRVTVSSDSLLRSLKTKVSSRRGCRNGVLGPVRKLDKVYMKGGIKHSISRREPFFMIKFIKHLFSKISHVVCYLSFRNLRTIVLT